MEKKAKWKKMVKINLSILVFCPTVYLATLKAYKKFEDSGFHRSREICNRKFDRREEKWTNNGNGKHQEADSLLHKSYPTFVPNFKILGAVVSVKSLTQIFLCITLEWEMEKWKKKAKNNLSILIFFPTIYLATLNVYTKFEEFGSHRSREIWWKKGKLEKDGKKKSQHLGFLSHNILGHPQGVYKIWKDSGSHRSREICNRKFDWRERKMDK